MCLASISDLPWNAQLESGRTRTPTQTPDANPCALTLPFKLRARQIPLGEAEFVVQVGSHGIALGLGKWLCRQQN